MFAQQVGNILYCTKTNIPIIVGCFYTQIYYGEIPCIHEDGVHPVSLTQAMRTDALRRTASVSGYPCMREKRTGIFAALFFSELSDYPNLRHVYD